MMTHLVYKCSIPHEYRCAHTGASMRPWFCYRCTQQDAELRYREINNRYRAGDPVCKDLDWDRYEAYCRARHPDSKVFELVGEIGAT